MQYIKKTNQLNNKIDIHEVISKEEKAKTQSVSVIMNLINFNNY